MKNKHSRPDAESGVANAAYTSADAVVESLAASHNVQSSDILDVSEKGGDLAVRLAIGETKVVQDNKAFFSAHGVELSALESALSGGKKADKRSGTCILIKNLPLPHLRRPRAIICFVWRVTILSSAPLSHCCPG